MGRQENTDAARRILDAAAAGDLPRLLENVTDDIVWHQPGRNVLSGDYRGKEALAGLLGKMLELTNFTVRVVEEDFIASDERAIWFLRLTAQREGKSIDVRLAQPATFSADGRMAETWYIPNDRVAWDEFFS